MHSQGKATPIKTWETLKKEILNAGSLEPGTISVLRMGPCNSTYNCVALKFPVCPNRLRYSDQLCYQQRLSIGKHKL